MVRCIVWSIVGIILFALAPAFSAQPARRPPAANPAQRKEAADRWLREGKDSLAAGAYEAARDRFSDVLELDPRNAAALHGLALSHAGLGDLAHAKGPIQGALDAEIRSAGIAKVNKPLLLNYAMVMISAGEPMKAAKALSDYQRLNKEPDEAILNALAIALNTADPAQRRAGQYTAFARLYEEQNAKLEATRPGQRRWGTAWRSAADFEQESAMWKQDMVDLEKLYQQLALKADELRAIQLRHDRAQNLIDQTGIVPSSMTFIKQTLAATSQEYDALLSAYQDRAQSIRRPTFPVTMSAVAMDAGAEETLAALTPPPPTAVATAVEPVPAARRTGRRPRPVPGGIATAPNPEVAPKPMVVAPSQTQTPDLVVPKAAGKRTVIRPAAAFAIAPDLLLTTAAAVEGAKEIQVTDLAGRSLKGERVRADESLGLALIRVTDGKLIYGQIADAFRGGPVQCVSLAPSIFQPVPELIPGTIRVSDADQTLSLQRMPRRGGSPLVSANKIIGVELGDRSAELNAIPFATLDDLRRFCADDLGRSNGPYGNPNEVLCELLITSEVE